MTTINSSLSTMAAAPSLGASKDSSSTSSSADGGGTFFEALSQAWGKTLDGEANKIESMSNGIGNGSDNPSEITKLTAESMRMSFMSQSSSTSIDSVGKSLETMARKN